MKKNYTANFKAQVVLDLLKEEKTITEIAKDAWRPSNPT